MGESDHDADEMREEYDFSKGVRGKHYRAYRAGHTVEVRKSDGSVEQHRVEAERRSAELEADPSIALSREELWQRVDKRNG